MLVFKVAALLLVLLGPAIAQLTIDPDFIFDAMNPVCVTLNLDIYTQVQVREETTIKINCSFVRSSFIAQNSITDESRVSIRWLFAQQNANLMGFGDPITLIPEGRTTIEGDNNEIVRNSGVRIPTLAVDGTTGQYTCEVCSDRGTPTESCTNSTVPIPGRRFPPDIDQGEPNGACTVLPFPFNLATCNVGTNYCIPPGSTSTIQLLCQHNMSAPATPPPQVGVWFLNGVQISSTADGSAINGVTPSNVEFRNTGQRLTISNPAMAPLGNYTCMLMNIAGFDRATTIITNCVPPVLEPGREIDPSTIQIGLMTHCRTTPQTTILCELQSGSQVITYSWTRNGVTIPGATSDRLNVNETGIYNCTATNAQGSDSARTEIAEGAMITFNGRIAGRSDNGCSRLTGTPPRTSDICVFTTETLEFVCDRAPGGNPQSTTPQITNPGGMVTTSPVTNVQPSSDGTFRCSSSTTQCGETSMTIDVQVFTPPMIDRTTSLPQQPNTMTGGAGRMDITTQSGSTVRLFCPSPGRPPAMITWQRRDGGNLVGVGPPGTVTNTTVGGIPAVLLTLTNVQGADFTEYACTATNVAGSDTQSITLIAEGAPPVIDEAPTPAPGPPTGPDPDNIIRIGAKTCIPANGNVRIDCNTLSGTAPFTYVWRRNGAVISNPTPPESLVVTMAGSYECRVSNTFGADSATSEIQITPSSVNFQITSNGPIDCGRLNPVPMDIDRCPRFARVNFDCTSPQGQPTQITRNGVPLAQNVIDPFGTADDGVYRCTAANSCGMNYTELIVQAFQPAEIDVVVPLPPPDIPGSTTGGAGRDPVDASIGSDVTLFCPTTGVNLPMTEWQIDGMRVNNSTRIVVTSRNISGQIFLILSIMNVTENDQTTYTCVTRNADGPGQSRSVVVREPPRNEWWIGTWSACTPDCHRGTRSRTVFCEDIAQRVLSDLSCSPPKPALTATCETRGPCFLSPVWRPGEWTPCTRPCGTGSRIRPVDCVIPRTNTVVDDGQCVHIARPKSYELCNTLDCCKADRYPTLCRLLPASLCSGEAYQQACCWTCGGT